MECGPVIKVVVEFEQSLNKEPPIAACSPGSCVPPTATAQEDDTRRTKAALTAARRQVAKESNFAETQVEAEETVK